MNQSTQSAIVQIKKKDYLQPYQHSERACYAIGVNFSSKEKKVEGLLWEQVDSQG